MDVFRQVSKYLGTDANATKIVFTDTGDEGRLKFDKNKQLGNGSGGSRVFLGTFRQPVTNVLKLVAIKHVNYSPDEDLRKTYREVENLQQLTHPNVVQYLFADKVDTYNIMLIALELCRGSLIDLFSHRHDVFKKPFILKNQVSCDSWWFKKDLLLGVAKGLSYVHSRRYLHMDLKPQNVLVQDDDNNAYGYKAVLCDFELTRKMKDGKAKLSLSQEAVGTHGWMAREVLYGAKKLAPVIDVFAYGCIVHFVLSENRTKQHIHPFGLDIQRDNNILKSKRCSYICSTLMPSLGRDELHDHTPFDYSYLGDSILADMLVDACISSTISLRPQAAEILGHPFFWSYSEKIRCTEQMFNNFKDNFESESLISLMEDTWSSLDVHEYCYLIPEAWNYLVKYRRNLNASSSIFDMLMRLIRNLQQHYNDALQLYPVLGDCLPSGDDETLGRYFFERVPLSFPVIYTFDRLSKDTDEMMSSSASSRATKLHELYKKTLKNVQGDHPAL